ncbi:MAG: ROK family protein [Steroidobacteraceae bacterium]
MTGNSLGIDVGGSSIKHGVVEVASGSLAGPLGAVPTPQPSAPQALVAAITGIVAGTGAGMPVGVTLPSVIRQGTIHTAANVDASLIGFPIESALREATGRHVVCLNDADAAGLAEMRLGAGRGQGGVVMVLTLGTGIGSALFVDGRLVPNTELGHLQMRGQDAECWASARVRTEQGLGWEAWAQRVTEYLDLVHALFWPELFVLGGGVSEEFGHFGPLLKARCPVKPARLGAAAGVVGAALAAAEA